MRAIPCQLKEQSLRPQWTSKIGLLGTIDGRKKYRCTDRYFLKYYIALAPEQLNAYVIRNHSLIHSIIHRLPIRRSFIHLITLILVLFW